jgi:hypothetical protein
MLEMMPLTMRCRCQLAPSPLPLLPLLPLLPVPLPPLVPPPLAPGGLGSRRHLVWVLELQLEPGSRPLGSL